MTRFEDILNQSLDELPEPKDLPDGTTWHFECRRAFFVDAKGDAGPRVVFIYRPIEFIDGTLPEGWTDEDMEMAEVSYTIWLDTPRDLIINVRRHIDKHEGVEKGDTLVETLSKGMRGATIIADVYHRSRINNRTGEVEEFVELRNFRAES